MTAIARPARFAECCACQVTLMCAPVHVAKGRWFWFCAGCTRAATAAWAVACRTDEALATQIKAQAERDLG